MTEPTRDDSELKDLLSSVWDGRLDERAVARIEELVSKEPKTRLELLISYSRMHLDLELLVSTNAAEEKALESFKNSVLIGSKTGKRKRRLQVTGLVALAAGILVVVFSIWNSSPPGYHQLTRVPQPLGRVARLQDVVWSAGNGHLSDNVVWEGQTVDLQSGNAQISMGFGADLLLEGPCRVEFLSRDRIALRNGNLAVRAAKWATGFKVETDDLVATDLGTWFSVHSGDGKPSEIHVLEGSVLAKPFKEKTSSNIVRQLKALEAVHMARDGSFQAIEFRREAAVDKLTQFQPLRPIEIWNTGIGLREGDIDPHWRVIQGHEKLAPYPQPTVVSVPHGSYGINEPERSQWISVQRGTTKGVPARSRYTFETTFDLTGFDLKSVWISGLILADDGVDEVWLNGKQLEIEPWKDWGYGATYAKFHPVVLRSGFVPGINRLEFVVKNETFIYRAEKGFELPDSPNPMAFRAEWQAFGRPLQSEE